MTDKFILLDVGIQIQAMPQTIKLVYQSIHMHIGL